MNPGGKLARRELHEQQAAATKMQAAQRGKVTAADAHEPTY